MQLRCYSLPLSVWSELFDVLRLLRDAAMDRSLVPLEEPPYPALAA